MPLRARITRVPARKELANLSLLAGLAVSSFLSIRLAFSEKLDEIVQRVLGCFLLFEVVYKRLDLLLLFLRCLRLGFVLVSDLAVLVGKCFEFARLRLLLLGSVPALLRFRFLCCGVLVCLGR